MTEKTRERIKDVILVVLFVLTILLLYLYLNNKSTIKIKDIIPVKRETESIDAREFIVPEEIVISNADGSYRKAEVNASSFETACAIFSSEAKQGNAVVAEITEEQYLNAVRNYRSVQYILSYDIPFSDFCTEYEIKKNTGYSSVGYVSTVCFSEAAEDSILIADKVNGSYYRFISEMETDIDTVIGAENIYEGTYFESSQVLGTSDNALIPIGAAESLLNARCEAEIVPEMEQARVKISENIFGETYDFVRRISDSFGNITYIYGYGQKSLGFNANGTVEYRSEDDGQESTGFFEDLETVLSGLKDMGGCMEEEPYISLFLSRVTSTGEGKNTKRTFVFTQKYGEYTVYGDAYYAVEATVSGGKLIYLKRNTVTLTQIYKGDSYAISCIEAIANSSTDMYSGRLRRVSIGYYDNDGDMVPVYALDLTDGSCVTVNMKGEVL